MGETAFNNIVEESCVPVVAGQAIFFFAVQFTRIRMLINDGGSPDLSR